MEGSSLYRLTVRGLVSDRLTSAFEGMSAEPAGGTTVLVGCVRDQAHLYGLLERIQEFGLELVAVEEVTT